MKIVDIRKSIRVSDKKPLRYRDVSKIRSLAIHHSLTTSGSPEAFANYHIDTNGWPCIGYTYVIMRNGTIYWCMDHNVLTYHVGNSNSHALGICMVGDFRVGRQEPTKEQYDSLLWLLNYLRNTLPNKNLQILGHQEYPGYSWKDCPTNHDRVKGFMDKIRRDADNYLKELEGGNVKVQFEKSWMWTQLENNFEDLYKAGILNSKEWAEKARKKELTLSELGFVNNAILTRVALRKGM